MKVAFETPLRGHISADRKGTGGAETQLCTDAGVVELEQAVGRMAQRGVEPKGRCLLWSTAKTGEKTSLESGFYNLKPQGARSPLLSSDSFGP